MSNVPAWTRPGQKALPRSIEVRDRRVHEHTTLRSCTSHNSSEDQLNGELAPPDTTDH
jgi:hypothetical protein